MLIKIFTIIIILLLTAGCAVPSLSKQALGVQPPLYKNIEENNTARISSSSEQKYETVKGTPRAGELIICTEEGLKTTIGENTILNPIIVKASNKIILTTIIKWENTGWEKTCYPFVSFIPGKGDEYVIVNEVIGGKGVSALWTGIAFQSCEISVYKLKGDSFSKVSTENVKPPVCGRK